MHIQWDCPLKSFFAPAVSLSSYQYKIDKDLFYEGIPKGERDMSDLGKIHLDSPSEKGQKEPPKRRMHNFLAPSTSSEQSQNVSDSHETDIPASKHEATIASSMSKNSAESLDSAVRQSHDNADDEKQSHSDANQQTLSHEGTSPLLSEKIAEKGLNEINRHIKKKAEITNAEKFLKEVKEKLYDENAEEYIKSLTQQLAEYRKNINEINTHITELYIEWNRIAIEKEHCQKMLEENHENFEGKQKDLKSKQKEFADSNYNLKQKYDKIVKQEKKQETLKSFQQAAQTIRDSAPTDAMTSQDLERSLDTVFTSPEFHPEKNQRLKNLQEMFQARKDLIKDTSRFIKLYESKQAQIEQCKNVKTSKYSKIIKDLDPEYQKRTEDAKQEKREINDKSLIEKIEKTEKLRSENSKNDKSAFEKYKSEIQFASAYVDLVVSLMPNIENIEKDIKEHLTKIKLYSDKIKKYNEARELAARPETQNLVLSVLENLSSSSSSGSSESNHTTMLNPEMLNSEIMGSMMPKHVRKIKTIQKQIGLKNTSSTNLCFSQEKMHKTLSAQFTQIESSHHQNLSQLSNHCTIYGQHIAKLEIHQSLLQGAVCEYEDSLERIKQFKHESLQYLIDNFNASVAENLYSKIENNLKSSEKVLTDLNIGYVAHKEINERLCSEIFQLEKDISDHKENIYKQKEYIGKRENALDKEEKEIKEQIKEEKEHLAKKKEDEKVIRNDLDEYESAVMPALRRVKQAQMEVDAITQSFGNDPNLVWKHIEACKMDLDAKQNNLVEKMRNLIKRTPHFHDYELGPGNTEVYSEKWAKLEPITHPQTGEVLNLRNNKHVKDSQTILTRLTGLPEDPSQNDFWVRYAGIINRTIKAYENQQPEGAQQRLLPALEKLNEANDLANQFLDVMYGKLQETGSSQGQA
jgi:regulator of replication initiation timing